MGWAQVLAIVLPIMFTIVIGIFFNNRRIDDLRADMNERFSDIGERFSDVNERFSGINERFSDMNQRIVDLIQQMNRQFAELKAEIRENRSIIMQLLRKEIEI